ncbi:MAG: hypothetical protein ACREOO_07475 [bacterium]
MPDTLHHHANLLLALGMSFFVGGVRYHNQEYNPAGTRMEALGMTPTFIGIVFLAIIGGAAESLSAVTMARKNKMDLTMGIALGSCIQIALFVAPLLVLLSALMFYFIPEV